MQHSAIQHIEELLTSEAFVASHALSALREGEYRLSSKLHLAGLLIKLSQHRWWEASVLGAEQLCELPVQRLEVLFNAGRGALKGGQKRLSPGFQCLHSQSIYTLCEHRQKKVAAHLL